MATLQTAHAKRQMPAVVAYQAGITITQVFTFDFTGQALVAAADRIELGMLPAGAQLIGLEAMAPAAIETVTATVGIMSGEFGDNSNARTVATPVISAGNIDGASAVATRAACLAVPPAETHRSIGLTLSANVAAGAGKTITVVAEYVF